MTRDEHPTLYLKPSLLDRLSGGSDSEPTGAQTPTGGADPGGLRVEVYHDTVLRDLEWLFNATAPLALADGALRRRYPNVAASVLGYGLRGVLGRVVTDPTEIERQIEHALATFEPRLLVEDISLKFELNGQLVKIQISGLLLTQQARHVVRIQTNLETLDSRIETERNG